MIDKRVGSFFQNLTNRFLNLRLKKKFSKIKKGSTETTINRGLLIKFTRIFGACLLFSHGARIFACKNPLRLSIIFVKNHRKMACRNYFSKSSSKKIAVDPILIGARFTFDSKRHPFSR